MKLAIIKERRAEETRVAASPETVKKLTGLGLTVCVETGAGASAYFSDDAFREAGAEIAAEPAAALKSAALVFKVQGPLDDELAHFERGSMLVGLLNPFAERARIASYAAHGVDAFALEFLPRISRAQSMDVLSSQSNLAGYKAVLDASAMFERAMPQMMTAAGTVAPARVFVMGAGVAGLQAIATARRLGARVSATDVRLAAKEQVASLGASFVMVDDEEAKQAETSAGYAKEMSDAYKQKQAALIAETVAKQDIVITTALIPGRKAPRLMTEAMVRSMKPGSIIIDLAAEQGGNVEGVEPGGIVDVGGVKIVGAINLATKLPVDASALYARNLVNFITPLIDPKTKTLKLDWDDEIVKGAGLTRDGKIVHPAVQD